MVLVMLPHLAIHLMMVPIQIGVGLVVQAMASHADRVAKVAIVCGSVLVAGDGAARAVGH